MSAPNAGRNSPPPESQSANQQGETEGRNSPDPESQSGRQQGDTPGGGDPNKQGAAPSMEHAKEASEDAKNELESNPVHPLAQAAEEKTGKQTGVTKG